MNISQLKKRCALLIALALLFPPSLLITSPRSVAQDISQEEMEIVANNGQDQYVYLGRDESSFYELMSEIAQVDENSDSLVHQVCEHIDSGFSVGSYDAVVGVLEYAELLLKKKYKSSHKRVSKSMIKQVRDMARKVRNGDLAVKRKKCSNKFAKCFKTINSLNVINRALFNRSVRIGQNLEVDKDTTLSGKLDVFGKAHFRDKVIFDENVRFKNNVLVEGDLTVSDSIITTRLVTETLSAVDATIDNLTVTNCIADVCLANVSIADVTIDTLSATDAFITNAFITNLAADNALIDNLFVNNELANSISTVDLFAQNFTAADVVIDNISVTELIAQHISTADIFAQHLSAVDGSVDHIE
jgi:hypothetical protein